MEKLEHMVFEELQTSNKSFKYAFWNSVLAYVWCGRLAGNGEEPGA